MKKAIAWLKNLYVHLRAEKMRKYQRCLPFSELIVDRFEKARYLEFGEGTSIYDNSYVFGSVKVGKNTWIGPFTVLDGSAGLEIGDNCSISTGVQIYTHDTTKWAITGGKASYEYGPVKIESNCYIGPNTVIGKGVIIGEGTIIGASSLVLENIPAHSKAWGIPCKVRGTSINISTIPKEQ